MSKLISTRRRLNTSIKVAALVAALGFVTVVLEQPRLTASPSRSGATIEQTLQPTGTGGAPMTRSASEPAASGDSRLPVYFPGQFAAPGGEIEPQPTGF
jgi:hypothetical protein